MPPPTLGAWAGAEAMAVLVGWAAGLRAESPSFLQQGRWYAACGSPVGRIQPIAPCPCTNGGGKLGSPHSPKAACPPTTLTSSQGAHRRLPPTWHARELHPHGQIPVGHGRLDAVARHGGQAPAAQHACA